MSYRCKICETEVKPRNEVANITYYSCPDCGMLQNFHWEERNYHPEELQRANDKRREQHWTDGDRAHMHQKGWDMLQRMVWPPAQLSRKLNNLLMHIPGYEQLMKWWVRRKVRRLLDFGCGSGQTVIELNKRDQFDAVGLDPFSPTEHPAVLRVDLHDAKFPDNEFDGIFTIETMEHISNILEVFTELHRILKPGGTLLVQTHRTEDPDYAREGADWFYLEDPTTHVSVYSEDAMRRIAKKVGFRDVSFRGAKFARFTK